MVVGPRALVIPKTKLGTLELDVCLEESHQYTNTITDHPVEDGGNISDHSRPDPDLVTLRCFVSNTPLATANTSRTVQQGDIQFTTSAAESVQLGDNKRGKETFDALMKMRDEGQLIKVVTTLCTYPRSGKSTEGMLIQSLTIPRTSKNFDGLEFSATLKLIRIVQNRSTRDTRPKNVETARIKHKGAVTSKGDGPPTSAAFAGADAVTAQASKSSNGTIAGVGSLGQGFLHK